MPSAKTFCGKSYITEKKVKPRSRIKSGKKIGHTLRKKKDYSKEALDCNRKNVYIVGRPKITWKRTEVEELVNIKERRE